MLVAVREEQSSRSRCQRRAFFVRVVGEMVDANDKSRVIGIARQIWLTGSRAGEHAIRSENSPNSPDQQNPRHDKRAQRGGDDCYGCLLPWRAAVR
jgi:hypothetical protein